MFAYRRVPGSTRPLRTINWFALSILLILTLAITACTVIPSQNMTDSATKSAAATQSAPVSTATPVPTATQTPALPPLPPLPPSPTATHVPSATAVPTATLTPTVTPTPLPWAGTLLSIENAAQIEPLAVWGRGPVIRAERAGEDRVLALSTIGVFLYREAQPELIAEYPGAAAFLVSPDGGQAALVFPDGTQSLINLESGETEHSLDTIVELSKYFCDTCTQAEKEQAVVYQYGLSTWLYSLNGSLVAASFNSGVIGVWDTATGDLRWKLYHESVGVADGLLFSHDLQSLISVSVKSNSFPGEFYISRWSLDNGKLVWYKYGYGELKPDLLSPDDSLVGVYGSSSGGTRESAELYSMRDGTYIGSYGGMVSASPFSPDSKRLVITYARDVQIYQLQPSFTRLRTLWTKLDWPSASFSADGATIVLNDGQAVYSADDYSLLSEGEAPQPAPEPAPIFSPSVWLDHQHLGAAVSLDVLPGPSLSAAGGQQLAWRWDPLSGTVQKAEFSAKLSWAPAFSPDRLWAGACTEAGVELRRFDSDETRNFGRCPSNGVLAFSPTGKTLLVSSGTSYRNIQGTDGAPIQDYVGTGDRITWMEYSPDGSMMASGGRICGAGTCKGDQHLWIINPPGRVPLESEGSGWATSDVVFSSDQSIMYSAKNAVWKWNAVNGQMMGRVSGDGDKLALSPDDSLLAVGTNAGQILLISTHDRDKELARLDTQHGAITALVFTADGASLISAAADGSITLWGVR